MSEFKNAKEHALKLLPALKTYKQAVQAMEEAINPSELTADERQWLTALNRLEDAVHAPVAALNYLQKPVAETGTLTKNEDGRYELPGGHTFTSGSTIEVYTYDEWDEVYRWDLTRIEHTDGDYYAVGVNQPLSDCKVRIRET